MYGTLPQLPDTVHKRLPEMCRCRWDRRSDRRKHIASWCLRHSGHIARALLRFSLLTAKGLLSCMILRLLPSPRMPGSARSAILGSQYISPCFSSDNAINCRYHDLVTTRSSQNLDNSVSATGRTWILPGLVYSIDAQPSEQQQVATVPGHTMLAAYSQISAHTSGHYW
jgi:hypothetical protein